MTPADLALRVIAGFVVAVLCTPAGVSGAFLLLPVQVLLFGAPSPAVTATNLLYNVTSTPAGVVTFQRHGRLDRPLARRLCVGTAPGVVLGVLARSTVLADEEQFAWVAAVVLGGLGIRLLLDLRGEEGPADGPTPSLARLTVLGLVAGTIGGIYGLGGAAIVVPWLVSVERVPLRSAAGAGLVTTLVTSVLGLVTFIVADALDVGEAAGPQWWFGLALGAGGAVGAVVGARLQPRLPVALLRAVLALAALSAAVRLALG